MILRALLASIAVVAIPLTVVGAAEPQNESTKKTCKVGKVTGSRLGGVRRCRTQSEWDQEKAESRDVTQRIQSQKNMTEQMVGMKFCSNPRGQC
jgi:hypothetical protein